MQAVVGLHFGAWLVLWLAVFAWVKATFPGSAADRVLAVLC